MWQYRAVLSIALVLTSTSAYSAPDDVIAKCSETKNGRTYIPKERFAALAKNLARPLLAKFDDECKGYLTKEQQRRADKGAQDDEKGYLQDLKDMASAGGKEIPAEQARTRLKLEEDNFDLPFLIRDAYHIQSLAALPKARDDAEGASISYTRDNKGSNDIIAATGAIIGWNVLSVDSKKTAMFVPPGFTRSLIAPGVEFDQQRNRADPTKNVDYLGFRFIGELEREGPIFDLNYLRYSGYLKTDSRSDSKIWGGYLEWQPYRVDWGIGGGQNLFGPTMLSFTPLLHAEYERVTNAGNVSGLTTGDEYFRAGAILGANMWFRYGLLRNLTLAAQYRYLPNLTNAGHNKDAEYFQATVGYNLTSSGNAAISVKYRDGQTPGNGTTVRDIKTELAVKF
ncbi:MAG: hypothetical protein HYX37_10835 [Rhizobiales bacterium]|nr:hypothetical protein [Hyphomicrobiales bacterium]